MTKPTWAHPREGFSARSPNGYLCGFRCDTEDAAMTQAAMQFMERGCVERPRDWIAAQAAGWTVVRVRLEMKQPKNVGRNASPAFAIGGARP